MAVDLQFEWDPGKNTLNIRRHKVSFDEASTSFLDENALLIDDPDHSEEEDRFILLGLSSSLRILLVCHCYRAKEGLIRIISARKADRQERQDYLRRFTS
ncbi:BrnT family toxin [Geothrix sp. 21YS21S-2]|uniref:BrnT family toxin n=1 Tax=Geothrix sp. 21YS21S-2 TaxID=3068893 RepID=UPI00358E3950